MIEKEQKARATLALLAFTANSWQLERFSKRESATEVYWKLDSMGWKYNAVLKRWVKAHRRKDDAK